MVNKLYSNNIFVCYLFAYFYQDHRNTIVQVKITMSYMINEKIFI